MSKSELKRRQKQRQKEEEKKKKAAAAPPKAPSKKVNNEDLNPNQFYEMRCREIQGLLNSSEPSDNPYPHKFEVNYDPYNFEKEFGHLKSGETEQTKEIRLAGRIFTKRASGSKLVFYDIRTGADSKTLGSKMQVMCQAQYAKEGGVPFEKQHEHLARG